MNETNSTQFTERIYRRFEEPIRIFGLDPRPDVFWCIVLVLVLAAAFFYVTLMYIKDSRGVGPWWATLLGLLRSCVYLLIAAVFLLPAIQTWEQTEIRSKVLVLFDVSNSITAVVDEIPDDKTPLESLPTRQDKVLRFLLDEKKAFLSGLEKRKPITAGRLAQKLDANVWHFSDGAMLTQEEREERAGDPERKDETPDTRPVALEMWQAWLKPNTTVAVPDGWSDAEKKRFEKLVESNDNLARSGFFSSTNLHESILALLNREANSVVHGLIVFTDGRSTGGQSLAEQVEKRARDNKIPIFVVGIGEERPQVRQEFVDLRAPGQVQPEDKFRAVVEVYGEGLSNQPFDLALDLTHTKKGKGGKEEELPIVLIEMEDKSKPDKKREEIDLGKKVTLKPATQPTYDRSTPPRAEVEFTIDAATLASAAGATLPPGKKFEIGETKDGEFRLRGRLPKHKLEIFAGKEHLSDSADLRVIKRPLRVLLFASAPMRDYQFVRTMLVREVDKKRAELTIYLQLPPGRNERRVGVVQDVPPDRLLPVFPDRLDAGSDKPDEKLLDLGEYDVIVAFDPDWTQLSDVQLKLVEKWVEKGGGLIVIGGPINTLQLARPGANKDKLKPILDLYPVVLKDIRIDEMDRKSDTPFPLLFEGATPDMEFLKLDEGGEKGTPAFLSDWQEFFFGKTADKKAQAVRGFYNYYPAENTKPGAQVVARFGDPSAKLKDGVTQQPFLVLSDPNSGRRVIWIGSGETWRLRQYREAYHERFWTKLTRYAGAKNQATLNKRVQINMGRIFTANRPVEVEAKIDDKGGSPLPRNARPPRVNFKAPVGVSEREFPPDVEMKPKPGQGREGWFIARVTPKTPGEYSLEIKVPDTGDTASTRFIVKEANPEMDNTRPDFEALWRLASPARDVINAMSDATAKNELKRRLQRPKLDPSNRAANVEAADETGEASLRLYFDLQNAELIPACINNDPPPRSISRGPIQDLWDLGFALPLNDQSGNPITVSYVLCAIVALLSIEWLTRKLLRLA